MSQNPDWKSIFIVAFILGVFSMGLLSYLLVTKNVKQLQYQCELNIPRNQNCVMQFVPEIKK